MYVYLSKILPLLFMPLGVTLFLCVIALVLLSRERRRAAGLVVGLALAVLWVSSTPIVASSLYGELERLHPPLPMERIPEGGCIVVLGGALSPALSPRVDVEFNEAVDRVYKAAQLYRAGKGKVVVVTAGNQPWSDSRWAEAELIRDLLMEWGVPEQAVLLEGSSRNTRENALYAKNIIVAIGCEGPLLVTSAAHMPRAVAAFEGVGVRVVPVSADVRVTEPNGFSVFDFLPNAHALVMTSDAIREWIGQGVYRLQGWN